ncbi:MAG: ParB N-terminal domain-containing protein [Archangiaceae bacterium]|nr:ParB N-terminal domain-containing protein [Archangiaceae bacterium]
MGAPKKPRKSPRKKVEKATKGIDPTGVATSSPEGDRLAELVKEDGGQVLANYKDPLGGHAVVLAALPIEKVEPTPYQRDRSDTHVKKLTAAMERVGRFLDPLIAVRHDGKYWTPNGNHRLGAMNVLGMKTIVALVLPEEDVAYQILALNTEKAHNVKERSLEVIRMYRGLVGAKAGKESDHAAIFEEPYFATFGAAYEKRARFSAGAYGPVVRRLDSFLDVAMEKGLEEREKRADQLLAWDDEVAAVVAALKAKGFDSPYLKNYVVARVNFLRFKKDTSDLDFTETIEKLRASTKKIDPGSVKKEDLAKMGGAPAESSEE